MCYTIVPQYYSKEMSFGKYLLVAEGDEAEVHQAMKILHRHGTHSEIAVH